MSAHVITVRNVNAALQDGLYWLHVSGLAEASRNGPVLVAPGPVITEYRQPRERVLFSPARNANPFFHFMEALWMLAGRNDVAWIAQYNQRMSTYSDDGEHLHGAYGFRWREWFGLDQLALLVAHLRADPKSRRGVLSMWSPNGDLAMEGGQGGLGSKDLPCNTACYVDLRGGRLNLAVLCRSNDAIWGAYGANAVHFSFLQEYLAMQLRAEVGMLRQYSHNLHVYTDTFSEEDLGRMRNEKHDYYEDQGLQTVPLLGEGEDFPSWERDLKFFLENGRNVGYYTTFFREVATPLEFAWRCYKAGEYAQASTHAQSCVAHDWRAAALGWLDRAVSKKLKAAA